MNNESMDARRYLTVFGWLAVGFLALVAVTNYFIDPWQYFNRNFLGIYTNAEVTPKVAGMARHPYSGILLGNSKAGLTDVSLIHGPVPFYNAGLGGAVIEKIYAMLQRVPATAPIVVIELDAMEFGDDLPVDNHPFPNETFHDWLAYLFSRQIFGYSVKTVISAAMHQPPIYRDDGTFITTGWYEHYDIIDPAAHARLLDESQAQLRHVHYLPERLAYLIPLRAALEARHLPYLVYIQPLQAELHDRMRRVGLAPAFDAVRARIRQVFPQAVDLTESSYADPKNFFHQDLLHPYPNVEADMINREVLPRLGQ
jgi:hypothetical protein